MSRLTAVSFAASFVIAGCAAIAPSDITPATPAVPSSLAPPRPTLALSPATSPAPPRTTPAPTLVVDDFGADARILSDSFDDPASGWGVGSTAGGDVAYVDGTLAFTANTAESWMWSRRTLADSATVLRLEATFTPSAGGYQGLLCANSDDPLFGAVANAEGRWIFIRLRATGAEVLSTGQDVVWQLVPGVPTRVALDCAGSATGAFRMQLSLPDLGVGLQYEGGTDGPETFDRVGIYAEASADAYSLRVDDFMAYGAGS